jgi:hypothetical protein
MIVRRPENPRVGGSIPPLATTKSTTYTVRSNIDPGIHWMDWKYIPVLQCGRSLQPAALAREAAEGEDKDDGRIARNDLTEIDSSSLALGAIGKTRATAANAAQ